MAKIFTKLNKSTEMPPWGTANLEVADNIPLLFMPGMKNGERGGKSSFGDISFQIGVFGVRFDCAEKVLEASLISFCNQNF